MPTQAEVVWDPGFTRYDFGPTHPMSPVRLDLTARLCDAFGLFDDPGVHRLDPAVASDELLETVHSAGYVAAVKAASADPGSADGAYGLGTDDDPAFVGMHDASARVVAGTRDLCEAVWTGQTEHGVNFCGGLHHAMPDAASGFCIYNDVAIGIRWLLDHGVERVAYVDVDVHHGDGVERIFWNDDRVLTVSIHESGRALFPGTGWPSDIGGADAQGSATNIALPPGVADAGWLRAFHSTALPVVRAFRPQVLVSQHGCDTHLQDPLAHLALTVDAQREAAGRPAPAQPRGMRRPLGRARRRRVRDRRCRAAGVDAPHRHRRAPSDPRDGAGSRGLARARAGADRPARAVPDGRPGGRRGTPVVAVLGPGVRPRGPGRPRRHGDAAGGVPAARARRLLRLTSPAAVAYRRVGLTLRIGRVRPSLPQASHLPLE